MTDTPQLVVNGRVANLLPHQARFLNVPTRYPALIGGYGCGKSRGLIYKALFHGCALNPGLKGIYAGLTYPLLRDAIIPELYEVMDEFDLVEGRDWTLTVGDMVLKMHCFPDAKGRPAQVLFRPVDSPVNLKRLKSITAAWGCADEAGLMTEQAHTHITERVRHPRAVRPFIATGTTPEGLNWLYDAYVARPRERAATAGLGNLERIPGEQWVFVRGRTRDNPNLDPGYVDSLLSRYPEHLVEAYLEGYFVPLFEGRCFRFNEEDHVSSEARYEPMLPIRMAWDFNVNPMSVSLSHFHKGQLWTFDEIVLNTSFTEEVCHEFIGRYGKHESGVYVYGDAGGRSRSTKGRWTDYEIIEGQLGRMPNFVERVPRTNPSQRDGINSLNGLLRNGYGQVLYSISPRCQETIRSLLATIYDDRGGIEKGPDTYEHLSDGLRYLAWEIAPVSRTATVGRKSHRDSMAGLRGR